MKKASTHLFTALFALAVLSTSVLFPLTSLGAVDRAFDRSTTSPAVWVTQPSPVAVRELKLGLEESYRSLKPEMETILVRVVRQAEKIAGKTESSSAKSETSPNLSLRKSEEGKTQGRSI